MNFLDFIILIPILYFGYKGIKNGLIGELLGIIGLIVAVYLTFEYMDNAADIIRSFFGADGTYVVFIAAAIIFIVTLILAQLLDYLSGKFFQLIRLQALNRILGCFFGLLKGAIIMSVVMLILAGFQVPSQQAREESVTYSYVVQVAPWTYNLIATEDFINTLEETFEESVEDFPIFE